MRIRQYGIRKYKKLNPQYHINYQSYRSLSKLVLRYLATSDFDWQKFHELIPINMSCG